MCTISGNDPCFFVCRVYNTAKKKKYFSTYQTCSIITVVFVSIKLIKKTVKMLVKSLDNCNRNFRGQPAGLNRLTVAAEHMYKCSPLKRQKIDTISYPLIPLLFGSLSFIFCHHTGYFLIK